MVEVNEGDLENPDLDERVRNALTDLENLAFEVPSFTHYVLDRIEQLRLLTANDSVDSQTAILAWLGRVEGVVNRYAGNRDLAERDGAVVDRLRVGIASAEMELTRSKVALVGGIVNQRSRQVAEHDVPALIAEIKRNAERRSNLFASERDVVEGGKENLEAGLDLKSLIYRLWPGLRSSIRFRLLRRRIENGEFVFPVGELEDAKFKVWSNEMEGTGRYVKLEREGDKEARIMTIHRIPGTVDREDLDLVLAQNYGSSDIDRITKAAKDGLIYKMASSVGPDELDLALGKNPGLEEELMLERISPGGCSGDPFLPFRQRVLSALRENVVIFETADREFLAKLEARLLLPPGTFEKEVRENRELLKRAGVGVTAPGYVVPIQAAGDKYGALIEEARGSVRSNPDVEDVFSAHPVNELPGLILELKALRGEFPAYESYIHEIIRQYEGFNGCDLDPNLLLVSTAIAENQLPEQRNQEQLDVLRAALWEKVKETGRGIDALESLARQWPRQSESTALKKKLDEEIEAREGLNQTVRDCLIRILTLTLREAPIRQPRRALLVEAQALVNRLREIKASAERDHPETLLLSRLDRIRNMANELSSGPRILRTVAVVEDGLRRRGTVQNHVVERIREIEEELGIAA